MIYKCLKVGLFGATICSALATSVKAHECHALGQPNNDHIKQYWLCAGFTIEDGYRPRAGTQNNIDIIPIWVTSPDTTTDKYLDTRKGDTVDIKVTLMKINANYYDVLAKPDTRDPIDPLFFFKTVGVGYSSPISKSPAFSRTFTNLVPVTFVDDGETAIAYRSPYNFETPYAGLYAVLVEGTLKLKGKDPVSFAEKFVSSQPRIPFGPAEVDGTDVGSVSDFIGAPEGWFDSVRPANWPSAPQATASTASATNTQGTSPSVVDIRKRHH